MTPSRRMTAVLALACATAGQGAAVSAQTILERVLAMARRVDYGLILANVAETGPWDRALLAPGLAPRLAPAIDGSIALTALAGPGPAATRALAQGLPSLHVRDMTAMAIAAVNGGQAVTDYAVSVGVVLGPDLPPLVPGSAAQEEVDGAVAAIRQSGLGMGALAGDTLAALETRTMVGGAADLPAVLILNAAASAADVASRIDTRLAGLHARVDDLSATGLGAVNTGDVVAAVANVAAGTAAAVRMAVTGE